MITEDELETDAAVIIAVAPNGDSLRCIEKGHIKRVYAYDIGGASIFNWSNIYDEGFLTQNHATIAELFNCLEDHRSKEHLAAMMMQKAFGTYSKVFSKEPAYFDNEVIAPVENEVFIDCGAFDGDTIIGFKQWISKNGINDYEKCIALEPDNDNYHKLQTMISEKTKAYKIGAYDKKTILRFNSNNGDQSQITDKGDIEISVDTIDNILSGQRATYIKMDIEGSELKALMGAKETILKYRPRLAISLYHKNEDILTIPQYILSLHSNYKLFVRNYDPMGVDTVLYAI